jgi:hypothetical protein
LLSSQHQEVENGVTEQEQMPDGTIIVQLVLLEKEKWGNGKSGINQPMDILHKALWLLLL